MQELWDWADKHNIRSLLHDAQPLLEATEIPIYFGYKIKEIPESIGKLSNLHETRWLIFWLVSCE